MWAESQQSLLGITAASSESPGLMTEVDNTTWSYATLIKASSAAGRILKNKA